MNILLTGVNGRLGSTLQKVHTFTYAPSRQEMDICSLTSIINYIKDKKIQLIVHCAALTSSIDSETNKELYYNTNVAAVRRLLSLNIPILYMSTEYVFGDTKENGLYTEEDDTNPLTYYAFTKVVAEMLIRESGNKVIRVPFKLNPWIYEKAYIDQYTSALYLNEAVKEISLAIDLFDKLPNLLHMGGPRKLIFDLAKETRPDVKPMSRLEVGVKLPFDCSLCSDKWINIKNENA